MEANNLADFPRPVHHRIPNFKEASLAATRFADLREFQQAKTVKANPDAPQKDIRFFTLEARKTLLVPTPRLRAGLFNRIIPPPGASKETLRKCATSQGVRDYSVPVGLDAQVHVDLIVVGSVAVSEKGWRIGKGEGFADMEYAMMVSMGAIGDATVVVTSVHDCQIVDIPEELMDDHDLTVDYIFTPTRVIQTGCQCPKPWEIMWHKISQETLKKIPVLKILRDREKREGKNVVLGDGQSDYSAAGRLERANEDRLEWETPEESRRSHSGPPGAPATLYVGSIPRGTRVSEFKGALQGCHATPERLTWHGAQGQAFLSYSDQSKADEALVALKNLTLQGHLLRVEPARNPRGQTARPADPSRRTNVRDPSSV